MLKIVGQQISQLGEDSEVELITEGKYYQKGETTYLIYEESKISGIEGCTTTLKINKDNIKMRRFGLLKSEIEFEKGKRFKTLYNTAFGNIEMEVLTQKITNEIDTQKVEGKLDIVYDISLQGLTEGRNQINIEILQ